VHDTFVTDVCSVEMKGCRWVDGRTSELCALLSDSTQGLVDLVINRSCHLESITHAQRKQQAQIDGSVFYMSGVNQVRCRNAILQILIHLQVSDRSAASELGFLPILLHT
jgi:hypothetical protein